MAYGRLPGWSPGRQQRRGRLPDEFGRRYVPLDRTERTIGDIWCGVIKFVRLRTPIPSAEISDLIADYVPHMTNQIAVKVAASIAWQAEPQGVSKTMWTTTIQHTSRYDLGGNATALEYGMAYRRSRQTTANRAYAREFKQSHDLSDRLFDV
jgi:hypothetical protein